jgi:hypothetical protein
MPHMLSLGDVLGDIELTPGEVSMLLNLWADQFMAGSHHNMGLRLRDYATMLSNPETYGYKPPKAVAATDQPEYVPPSAAEFTRRYGSQVEQPANAPAYTPLTDVERDELQQPLTDAERDELQRLRSIVGNEPPPLFHESNPPS